MNYYGIVIEQSLRNNDILNEFNCVAEKQIGSWKLLLISISVSELEIQLQKLQDNMILRSNDCWYSHFFKDETLIIVYQDAIFRTTINPIDWDAAIQYGTKHGIPIEQLDFNPCHKEEAFSLFEYLLA